MRLLYRAEAGRDAERARRWYEEQQLGLGRAFREELLRAEMLLTSHPDAFPVVHGDHRRLVLRRFPYAIYFRPLDDETLEVVAVLHQRQADSTPGERR